MSPAILIWVVIFALRALSSAKTPTPGTALSARSAQAVEGATLGLFVVHLALIGTLLVFKNQPNAWHGFEPFEGPRKVIQLNWVTNGRVVWWEQTRHKISAFFKGKHEAPARM